MRLPLRSGVRAVLAIAVLVTATGLLESGASAAPRQVGDQVEVLGVGTGMVEGFSVAWSNALLSSSGGGSSINYSQTGSKGGRERWARGEADFVISGRPLTNDDQLSLAKRGLSAIEAPIAVSAMTFLMSPPYGAPLTIYKPPASEDDPFVTIPWTDPVRMPNEVLARIFLQRTGPLAGEPTFTSQIPDLPQLASNPDRQQFALQPSIAAVQPVVRSDPGAVDYYLEQFVASSAPAALLSKAASEQVTISGPTEAWPFLSSPSRTGDDQIAGLISGWFSPIGNNPATGGTVGPVSPSAATKERVGQAIKVANGDNATPLYTLEIQNGAGTYVAPTTATITRAAELAQGAPLAQLSDPLAPADAYPLTWISKIYVQSSGLSIDKTSAIATFIRYAVTAGQNAADSLGEGKLPASQVTQALAAADALVGSNCLGSDRKVVKAADGGPYWPQGVAPPTGGAFVCAAVGDRAAGAAVDATALVPGRAPTSAPLLPTNSPAVKTPSGSGVYVPPASSAGSYPADVPLLTPQDDPTGGDTSPAGPTTTAAPAVLAAASLPLGVPDDGRKTLDRLTTMLLGGAALLMARSVLRRTRSNA